jgi:hypothetical protein
MGPAPGATRDEDTKLRENSSGGQARKRFPAATATELWRNAPGKETRPANGASQAAALLRPFSAAARMAAMLAA